MRIRCHDVGKRCADIPVVRGALASSVLLAAALLAPGLIGQAGAAALRVPPGGVRVELWSDPEPGTIVYPGQRARVYFRANTDCYVTLIAVDTEGRVRLLFPTGRDDGWVRGGRTYRLPAVRGERIVFEGPAGIEYMYALASLEPTRHRYPMWLVDGRVWDPDPWYRDDDYHLYNHGFVIGDPFYQIHQFCRALVPYPDWTDTYSTAFISFYVGRRVHYPRYVCSDCHWGGWIDPYARTCRAVAIHVGDIRYRGWIDFRVVFAPRYKYRVNYAWRPLWWRGDRWTGPDGRWVWSSTDRRSDIRRYFADAGSRGDRPVPAPSGKPDQPYRVTRDGERMPDGARDRHAWERAHQERLRSSVKDQSPSREPDRAPRSPRVEEQRKERTPDRDRAPESDRAPRSPRVEEAPQERAPESGRAPRSPRAEEPPRERKEEPDRAPRSPRTEEKPQERSPRSGRAHR